MKRILFLGRFQPVHLGHLHAIQAAAARCDEIIIVVGSAQASYTIDNPFTAGERVEMLRAALQEEGITNHIVVPLDDLHRHREWVAYVESHVPEFDEVVTNNPLTKLLFSTDGYKVKTGVLWNRKTCTGTTLRRKIARGLSVDDAVTPGVRKILRRIRAPQRLKQLGLETL